MADQIGEILHNAFDKILADNDMKRRTICFISYKKKKIEKHKYVAFFYKFYFMVVVKCYFG